LAAQKDFLKIVGFTISFKGISGIKEGKSLSQLQDFLYELNRYTTQAHTLKDTYEKLCEDEKQKIMNHAPIKSDSPDVLFKQTVEWIESLNEHFAVDEDKN